MCLLQKLKHSIMEVLRRTDFCILGMTDEVSPIEVKLWCNSVGIEPSAPTIVIIIYLNCGKTKCTQEYSSLMHKKYKQY